MIHNITFYDDCDVYRGQELYKCNPEIFNYGINKYTSFGEVVDIAVLYGYNIIIKNGNGKWYLKHVKNDYESTKRDIERNVGLYPNRKCWLISYV
jgi:hypothetical protein